MLVGPPAPLHRAQSAEDAEWKGQVPAPEGLQLGEGGTDSYKATAQGRGQMWNPREANDARPQVGGLQSLQGLGWVRAPPGLTCGWGWSLSQEALALASIFSPFLYCLGEGHSGTLGGRAEMGALWVQPTPLLHPCPHTLCFLSSEGP